jgi:hypothetical protein
MELWQIPLKVKLCGIDGKEVPGEWRFDGASEEIMEIDGMLVPKKITLKFINL